jgi:hypothetical protein
VLSPGPDAPPGGVGKHARSGDGKASSPAVQARKPADRSQQRLRISCYPTVK